MVKNNINYIEGSGFIAKKFKKYSSFFKKNNCILYAAGVSNSLQNKKKEFEREIQRINKFIKINKKKIIYVSTYSIFDKSRNHKYVKNKIKIEKIIKKKVEKYIIFRLPEVVGSNKNPNTLVNSLKVLFKKKKMHGSIVKLSQFNIHALTLPSDNFFIKNFLKLLILIIYQIENFLRNTNQQTIIYKNTK